MAAAAASCDVTARTGGTVTVRRWRHNDIDIDTSDVSDRVVVVLNLSRTPKVAWCQAETWVSKDIGFASFSVIATANPIHVAVTGPTDVLLILLPTTLFGDSSGGVQLRRPATRFIARDVAVERIGMSMLVALHQRDPTMETLLARLAGRLADLLTCETPKMEFSAGGLPACRLGRLRRHIEARISASAGGPIRLGELAELAGLSPFHFIRAFKQSTGDTPASFVMRRRLELGRLALSTSVLSVDAIARTMGFASPAHFTQRFREEMGVTPSKFRAAMCGPADS